MFELPWSPVLPGCFTSSQTIPAVMIFDPHLWRSQRFRSTPSQLPCFHICLVVEPPLWKIWVPRLGWWFPIYGKFYQPCSKPPTRYLFHAEKPRCHHEFPTSSNRGACARDASSAAANSSAGLSARPRTNLPDLRQRHPKNGGLASAGWCPPVISWFINPINYSYICHKP